MFTALRYLALLTSVAYAADVLSSSGYAACSSDGDIQISNLQASFDRSTSVLTFNISGVSTKSQYVTGVLTVDAYGQQIYSTSFDPCDTHIAGLCPVPATSFTASGNQTIPEAYADLLPSAAYTIPDLDGLIKLQITQTSSNTSVGCIQASVTNGKTVHLAVVQYVSIGIVVAALLTTAIFDVMSAAYPGTPAGISPSFGETLGWFQTMAISGMLSVDYPLVYRSWTSNFGFSVGLFSWPALQQSIDSFRASTGGNLTEDSYTYLQNASLAYSGSSYTKAKRAISIEATASSSNSSGATTQYVTGIQAFSDETSVPAGDAFMTLLAIFAIAVAILLAVMLLTKLILEIAGASKSLSKGLDSWRQQYWWRITNTLTTFVVIMYGVWVLFSIYELANGDSWAAKLLAGLTLGLFTIVILGFAISITFKARQMQRFDGTVDRLYDDQKAWSRYGLFYDAFKRRCWWFFMPLLGAALAKGAIVAGADGHGLVQAIGCIAVEVVLLVLLIWTRPYEYRSGSVVNILLQIVKVLSAGAVLLFASEINISRIAKSITGFALIILQAVMTLLLAILILINGLRFCIRKNPERRRRRLGEKRERYSEYGAHDTFMTAAVPPPQTTNWDQRGGYGMVPNGPSHSRDVSDVSNGHHSRNYSYDPLLANAAGMGAHDRARQQTTRRLSEVSALSDDVHR